MPETCPQCGQAVPAQFPLTGWMYFCHNAACVHNRAPEASGCETKKAAIRAWRRACAAWRKAQKKAR